MKRCALVLATLLLAGCTRPAPPAPVSVTVGPQPQGSPSRAAARLGDGSVLVLGNSDGLRLNDRQGQHLPSPLPGLADLFARLVPDPAAPTAAYLLCCGLSGQGTVPVLHTADGGQTWQPWGGFATNEAVMALAFSRRQSTEVWAALLARPDKPEKMRGARSAGLYHSTDGGQTWARLPFGPDRPLPGQQWAYIHDLALDAAGRLWAATEEGTSVSGDGGQTWLRHNRGLPSSRVLALLPHPAQTETLYALTASGPALSRDSGATWVPIRRGLSDASVGDGGIAAIPGQPDRLLLWRQGDRHPYYSPNQGGEWFPVAGVDEFTWEVVATESLLYVTTSGGTLAVPLPVPRPAAPPPEPAAAIPLSLGPALLSGRMRAVATHPTNALVALAASEQSLWRTADGGASWERTLPQAEGPLWAVAFQPGKPEVAWALTDHITYRSADGGKSWRKLASYSSAMHSYALVATDPEGLVTSWWTSTPGRVQLTVATSKWWQNADGLGEGHYLLASAGGRIWAMEASGQVSVSTDGGRSFRPAGSAGEGGSSVYDPNGALVAAPDGSALWIGKLVSHDGGESWAVLATPGQVIAAGPGNPAHLLASEGNSQSTAYLSTDGGRTWLDVTADAGHPYVYRAAFAADGAVWLAAEDGLYRTRTAAP